MWLPPKAGQYNRRRCSLALWQTDDPKPSGRAALPRYHTKNAAVGIGKALNLPFAAQYPTGCLAVPLLTTPLADKRR